MKPYQYSREADIESRRRLYGEPRQASDESKEDAIVLFAIFTVAATALALVLFSGVQL